MEKNSRSTNSGVWLFHNLMMRPIIPARMTRELRLSGSLFGRQVWMSFRSSLMCFWVSIVGPRPDLELQQKDYEPEQWRIRHTVRPGITGLSQVNGRSNISFCDRVRYDISYAENHNLLLDINIILKTIKVVFRGRDSN